MIVWVTSWSNHIFFHWKHFLLERVTSRQATVIPGGYLYILKVNEWVYSFKKTNDSFHFFNDKIWALKQKLELLEMFLGHYELHSISIFKGFSGKIEGILINGIFDIAVSSFGWFT